MSIQLNPLLAYGMSALAGNQMPNLNLKTVAVDTGDKELAAGLLQGKEFDLKKEQLAQQLAIAKLSQDQANQRALLQAQTQLATNQNTVNATLRGQDMTAQTAANKLSSEEVRDQQKFDLDSYYKQNQISQKDQELHQTAVYDEFMQKIRLKDQILKQQDNFYSGFALAAEGKSPEEAAALWQQMSPLAVKQGIISKEDAKDFSSLDPSIMSNIAIAHSTLAKTALQARTNKTLMNEFDKQLDSQQAQQVTKIQEDNGAVDEKLYHINKSLQAIAAGGADMAGPITNWIGLANKSPAAQELESHLNALTLSEKNIQNMGSQGFTDRDREFLQVTQGNLGQYKGTIQNILQDAQKYAEHKKVYNWIKLNELMSQSNKPGRYEEWKQNNPEPKIPLIRSDGVKGDVPASELKQVMNQKDKDGKPLYTYNEAEY